MNESTRNIRISELYLTGNYSMRKLANRYLISPERVRQLIKRQIGTEVIREVKRMRSERTAERWKEQYLKNIKL